MYFIVFHSRTPPLVFSTILGEGGEYLKCLKNCTKREGAELDSDKLGSVEQGAVLARPSYSPP